METIKIKSGIEPDVKHIIAEIAYIVERHDKNFARGILAYTMGKDGAMDCPKGGGLGCQQ